MAVLITGGYGQLGSWLALELARAGEKVLILDVVRRRIDYLEEAADRLEFVPGSVLDFPRLVAVFREREIGGIIHTAAVMATPEFWANPHAGVTMNVTGTANLLEAARLHGVRKFLFVSSGAVYGELDESPSELRHPMNPSDLYGASKAAAEHIGLQYANHYGTDWRCARPYFFFGPGKFPSEQPFLFKNLLGPLEGLKGLALEKGAGQRLGFTSVRDTARGISLLYSADTLSHRTFNFASEAPVSFTEMARLARSCSARPTEVKIGPGKLFRRGETLDISLAKEELGYRPQYSVEDEMKEYAGWIEKNWEMRPR